jgi:flagellar hook assembly protein FlgD
VRTLVDGVQSADAGALQATWDGRADNGAAVSSGVYFYRLEAGGTIETRRMVLLK